jgi:transaldolase
MSSRAVFLDRDGVLNRALVREGKPYPPRNLSEFEILPGVPEAAEQLRRGGFDLIVVTNQPDVVRGRATRADVEAINARLRSELCVDEVLTCFHDDSDACMCRKPRPGFMFQMRDERNIDLSRSFLVGDRWRDLEAGRNAGCQTVLIDNHYAEPLPLHLADHICWSLSEAANWIMSWRSQMPMLSSYLKVKIFADGADRAGMLEMNANPLIKGLTTNPTLMRKAGVSDYERFARDILSIVTEKPISLEVFSDDFDEMERQALKIASWGNNVYVKIPVSNTKREVAYPLIRKLADRGVRVNVTAIMTVAQVRDVVASLNSAVPSCISIFAGRIADTGLDPVPLMAASIALASTNPKAEVIWASPRELLNVFQADTIGCHIITVTNDIIKKLDLVNYDLNEYSLDTVKMFHNDASQAGYRV